MKFVNMVIRKGNSTAAGDIVIVVPMSNEDAANYDVEHFSVDDDYIIDVMKKIVTDQQTKAANGLYENCDEYLTDTGDTLWYDASGNAHVGDDDVETN